MIFKEYIKCFIIFFKKPVRRLFKLWGFSLDWESCAEGPHDLVFKTPGVKFPPSVYFNTMSGRITIGFNTIAGHNVQFLTGKHMSKFESIKENRPLHFVPKGGRDIIVGDNCFFGSGAIVIGPCKIGDNCIIGAGAVVTGNIPADSFVRQPKAVVSQISDRYKVPV